jgi:hypothetical protein
LHEIIKWYEFLQSMRAALNDALRESSGSVNQIDCISRSHHLEHWAHRRALIQCKPGIVRRAEWIIENNLMHRAALRPVRWPIAPLAFTIAIVRNALATTLHVTLHTLFATSAALTQFEKNRSWIHY